jgi:hypothetical protein
VISIVGTRLASAAALLVLLTLLYAILPDGLFPMVVAVALIAAIGVQVTAVWFFGQRATQPGAPFTLRIRVQDAMLLLVASLALGVLATLLILRAFNAIPVIDRGVYLVGIAFGGLMLASPAVNALVIWTPWKDQ